MQPLRVNTRGNPDIECGSPDYQWAIGLMDRQIEGDGASAAG